MHHAPVASGRGGFVERPGRTATPSEPAEPCGSCRQRCACRTGGKYYLLIVLRIVWGPRTAESETLPKSGANISASISNSNLIQMDCKKKNRLIGI